MLWLGGATGRQRDITSSLLPVERLVLRDDPLLHAVLEHRHEQLQQTTGPTRDLAARGERQSGTVGGPHLVVRLGVVVQRQDVVQEDVEL